MDYRTEESKWVNKIYDMFNEGKSLKEIKTLLRYQ